MRFLIKTRHKKQIAFDTKNIMDFFVIMGITRNILLSEKKNIPYLVKRPETVEEDAVEMNSTATRWATCAAP
jgi:hypothetical protein